MTATSVSNPSPISGGEFAFQDGKTHNIYETSGAHNLSTFISATSLTSGTGGPASTSVAGLVALSSTVAITANSTSKSLFEYNNGIWSTLLTSAQIYGVTGGVTNTFVATAFFEGPDGNVYFFDNTSKDILDFDPSNAATTLSVAVPASSVSAAEGGFTTVSNLGWYNNAISWDNITPNGTGFYAVVPEPGSLSLLTIASLGLIGRRRSRTSAL